MENSIVNKFTTIILFSFGLIFFNTHADISKPFSVHEISKELADWNNSQKIKLLPHQLVPINYLEKHPEQHGLLIYHEVGTGKTYLGIAFAERNLKKRVIILVPRFLRGHWSKNIKNYGVKDLSRYEIISHTNASKLTNQDLSNTIIIIDESHRIISKIRSSDPVETNLYSKLYLNMKKANRVLSLTATPIFSDLTDLAYQINLVSGKSTIPFNSAKFREHLTKIKQNKSALVGHFAESNVTPMALMYTGTFAAFTFNPSIAIFVGIGASLIPTIIKLFNPVEKYPLRTFDIDSLGGITSKYISYYDIDNINREFYPQKEINYEDTNYNNHQIDFLMRFANSQLTTSEVLQLRQDEDIFYNEDYIELNSTQIQNIMKNTFDFGLSIGNLIYNKPGNNNELIYPEKFEEILELMISDTGSVMLYSHFYYNGILLFKQYLDAMGYQNKYAILHPDLSPKKFEYIVDQYNSGKFKFLLLHPEITEGASFLGTQQLHILEAPYNKSLQEQIIGRVIRYRSHLHLPQKQRNVKIYIWKATFDPIDLPHGAALRTDWQYNFSELNYYGDRTLVDPNNQMKSITPDELAYHRKNELDQNTEELINLVQTYSIETSNINKFDAALTNTFLRREIDPFEMPSISLSYSRYGNDLILEATGGNIPTKIKGSKNNIIVLHLDKPIFFNYINYGFDIGVNTGNYFFGIDTTLSLHLRISTHIKNIGHTAFRLSSGFGITTAIAGKSGTNDQNFLVRLGTITTLQYCVDYHPNKWIGLTIGLQNRFYRYSKSRYGKNNKSEELSSGFAKSFHFNITNALTIGIRTTI